MPMFVTEGRLGLDWYRDKAAQKKKSFNPVMSLIDTVSHYAHTHTLSSSWKPDESFICSMNTSVTHSSFRPNGRKRNGRWRPRSRGCERNNKITAVTGRPTHLSRSSRQWHLLGNWGCQSASPAELLCSSCSSPTGPLQNRQRTKPPETSGWGRWKGERRGEGHKAKIFTFLCTGAWKPMCVKSRIL